MSWAVQNRYQFQPSESLGRVVKIMLVASAVVGLLDAILSYGKTQTSIFTIDFNSHSVSHIQMPTGTRPLAPLTSLVGLAVLIFWLIWQHRVTKNVWAKGIRMDTSPGWAVAWWFIPIANLFMPAVAMHRVYRASMGQDKGGGGLVTGWWLTYIGASIVLPAVVLGKAYSPIIQAISDAVRTNQSTTVDLTSSIHSAAPWNIVGAAIRIVAAALAIVIVSRIDAAQRMQEPVIAVPVRPDLGL